MRFVWIGVKNPLLTDRCRHGSVYHNNGLWQLEINRRLIFWHGNPRHSEVVREGTNYKWNCHDHFYLKDVVGGIGIMLLKFRLLRSPDIFWKQCLVKPKSMKKRKSRGLHCPSTSVLDSLVVEVSESRSFYNNFVWLALLVFCPLASLAGQVSSSFFNHSSWLQCDPQSLRAKRSCSTLNLWVPLDFHLFGRKFDKNESQLEMKQPDQEQFTYTNEISHCNSRYLWQLAVNFNLRCQCAVRG